MRRLPRALAAATLAGAMLAGGTLAGCTVGPDFKPPPPVATAWHDPVTSSTAVTMQANPDPRWWNDFHDPVLTALMSRAIAGNLNLAQALLRVVEAHQSVTTAAAAGLPTLDGTGSYMREQLGAKGLLESNGAYSALNQLADNNTANTITGGNGATAAATGTNLLNQISQPVNLFQYELSASWELDLFGRVRRSVEQAKATQQAQAEAANDALVMLESQVAQSYLQLRVAQLMYAEQQQNVQAARASFNLTQNRQQRGLTSDLDVEQARTQLQSYLAQLPGYEKQTRQAIDQLNVLVGAAPGTIDAMLTRPAPLPAVPAVLGIGLPSTLARRRPDIREAEAQLHAATANVGVAVASFYPDVSLTGNLGLRATDASYLTNWASHFYSAGPSISLPIFEGGQLSANLRMARAQQAGAALNYRATVLNALREVEDALVAYRTDAAADDETAASVQSAALALYLSTNRYDNGLASYLQVLDAERTLVSDRQQLVQANAQVANDVVTLYTALGGGWQDSAPALPRVPALPPPLPAVVDTLAD